MPQVLQALGPNRVLYLTWDEGLRSDVRGVGGSGGGRIASSPHAPLRTLEAGFGLRTLGKAGRKSTPLLRGLLEPASGR